MKILFIISILGHGRGGHAHSLNHISRKLAENNTVTIISIGPGFSKVISENPHFNKHIFFNGYNLRSLYLGLSYIIKKYNPDIFHCFDDDSYNILRVFADSRKYKIINTKCGGSNPHNYPHVNNLILFSQENLDWFEKNPKFFLTKKCLIPNRVRSLSTSSDCQPITKDMNSFTFLRICRIGLAYKKSIYDSINLIAYLHSQGLLFSKLILVGVIEDMSIFNEIQQHPLAQSKHIIVITDSKYTTEASKLTYLADAVIGTGRGFMEAASLGKPLLAINSRDQYPTLIKTDNFLEAFRTNFSDRTIFRDDNTQKNLHSICLMIKDVKFYMELSDFSKKIFDKYFNIDNSLKQYSQFYINSVFGKRMILIDLPLILRSLFRFYKNRNNRSIEKSCTQMKNLINSSRVL